MRTHITHSPDTLFPYTTLFRSNFITVTLKDGNVVANTGENMDNYYDANGKWLPEKPLTCPSKLISDNIGNIVDTNGITIQNVRVYFTKSTVGSGYSTTPWFYQYKFENDSKNFYYNPKTGYYGYDIAEAQKA